MNDPSLETQWVRLRESYDDLVVSNYIFQSTETAWSDALAMYKRDSTPANKDALDHARETAIAAGQSYSTAETIWKYGQVEYNLGTIQARLSGTPTDTPQ